LFRTRICSDHFRKSDVVKSTNRPWRLEPRANPFIDLKKFPYVKQEPVKPTPLPEPKKPEVKKNNSKYQ
jgi:hypothetical protein